MSNTATLIHPNTSLDTTIRYPQRKVDLSIDIEEPMPLLIVEDVVMFTRGNISAITGKAKSRKTFLTILISSWLLSLEERFKVAVFDTEQSVHHTLKMGRRIHRLRGWDDRENKSDLDIFCLREDNTKQRFEIIKEYIEEEKPDFVFIDGVRDIVFDINNAEESTNAVNELMRYSSLYDCHICSILHENKGSDTLRGHLGTELQNKSETVITVSTTDNITKVEPKFTRNKPFDEFYFLINEQGLPEICGAPPKTTVANKLDDLFCELLPPSAIRTYAELRNMAMIKQGISERTAERKIKQALDVGILSKSSSGNYSYNHQVDEIPY